MNFNLPAILFLAWTIFSVFVFFPKQGQPEGQIRKRIRWYLIWMAGLLVILAYSLLIWAPSQEQDVEAGLGLVLPQV